MTPTTGRFPQQYRRTLSRAPRWVRAVATVVCLTFIAIIFNSFRLLFSEPAYSTRKSTKANLKATATTVASPTPLPPYVYSPPLAAPSKPEVIAPTDPLISQSIQANKTYIPLSHPSLATLGCPPPKQALIGIFTLATPTSAFHRQFLRQIYAASPSYSAFDIKYFYGNGKTLEMDSALALEETLFPLDTVITPRREGRDSGKILDWFKWARSEMYVAHPKEDGKVCLRYRFVGKGDEDAMFHLERLENLLKGLEGDGEGVARFVGRGYEEPVMHMTGMLYLLSANFVEWINASPVPRKLIHGIEDVMVGKWIQEGNLAIDFVEQGARFHDLPESDAFSRGEVTRETVVLHWCKDANRMYRCMTELFGNQMAEGQSAKRLTTPQALENRRNGFNLTETTGWIDTITKIEYVVESTPGKANLTQIDALIFRPHVIAQIDKLGLLEDLQPEEIDNIIHRVSLHGYHATTKTPIDAISIRRYVLFYLIKYRFPEEKRWNRKPVIYESAERLLKASKDRVIKLDEIDALWKRLLDEDEKKREEEKLKAALKTQGLEKEKTKKVDKKN